MGTTASFQRTLFSTEELPFLEFALVGQDKSVDRQVETLVDRMRRARSEHDVLKPLVILAKNIPAQPHFSEMLVEFVTTGSRNAMLSLSRQDIEFLLRAWGVHPAISAQTAHRVRRTMPSPSNRGARYGGPKRDTHLKFDVAELIARDGEELADVLKRVMKAAKLTPTEMAKKAEISRSQVYYLTGSKSLPRKPDQLARFLSTCRLHPEQVKFVLNQWARLDERRGEPPIVPELVGSQAPSLGDADAGVGSPNSAKATTSEAPAGTVRGDGPDGRSVGVVGSSGDVDREQLAKLLVTLTSHESGTAKSFRYGIAVLGALMVILTLVLLLTLGTGGASGSFLAAQGLTLITSTGVLLLIMNKLFGSLEAAIARLLKWRVRRSAVAAQAGAARTEEVDAKRPDGGRPDIRLVA